MENIQQLSLQKKIQNLHFQALKSIKLTAQEGQDPQIIKQLFHCVSELINNQFYSTILQQIIQVKLVQQKMDFAQLQKDKTISLHNSSVIEAIEEYVSRYVRNIIFQLECLLVCEGVVFQTKKIINMKKKEHQEYLKYRLGKETIELLQYLHKAKFEEIVAKFKKQQLSLNKQLKPKRFNPILQIKIPLFQSLFPQSFKDFPKIFAMKNSTSQCIQKILKQSSISNQDYQQFQALIERASRHLISAQYKSLPAHIDNQQVIKKLQDVYFYDIFMFRIIKLEMQPQQQCQLIDFIYQLFQHFELPTKILLLAYDGNLNSFVCSLLITLLKKYRPSNLAEQLKQTLNQLPINRYIVKLTQQLLNKAYQIMDLNESNLSKFDNTDAYVIYFREAYQKTRTISKNYRYIKQFNVSTKIQSINSFIQLQINLKKKGYYLEKGNFIDRLFAQEKQGSLFSRIYKFIKKQLQKVKPQCLELMINYLSLILFSDWFDLISQSPQQEKECLQNFKDLCNKYSLFANNSSFYLDTIFSHLEDLQLREILAKIKQDEQNQQFKIQINWITFQDHFSVALGNHINNLIYRSIQPAQQQQEKIIDFIIKYEDLFGKYCNKSQWKGLEGIFGIEFLKIYGQKYLQLLQKGEQIEHINRLQNNLLKDTQSARHLRIYLLKCIYNYEETFQNINQKYLKVEKCRWIGKLKEFIEEKKIEYFIPPSLKNHSKKNNQTFKQRLQNFSYNNYRDTQLYHQLLNQALLQQNVPENCYSLLTFFLMKIYNKTSCPEKARQILKRQLLQRGDEKQPRNAFIVSLLKGYLQGKITKDISFNNDQYKQQIVNLNYLNIIVSLRKVRTPISEMFFDTHGSTLPDYQNWLGQRFLLGSLHNPAVQRLQFILRQHSKGKIASSYTICSKTCDYVAPIGGTFYGANQGCAHPTSQAKCPFCGGILGAQTYNKLVNEQKGARIIDPTQINQEIKKIRKKQQITIIYKDQKKNLQLKGYHNGISQQQIRLNWQLKRHLQQLATDNLEQSTSIITNHLQSFVINLVWYFLASFQVIDKQSCKRIWRKDYKQVASQFKLNYELLLSQIQQQLKLKQEDFIVWNLGIGKILFKFLSKKSMENQKLLLLDSKDRDHFQAKIEEKLYRYYDTDKEKLILQSRIMQQVRKADIIKEIGNVNQHEVQFNSIKMYKIIKEKPGFQNFKNFYKARLHKEYPILAYLIYSQEIGQKLQQYRTIFSFLSSVQPLFNGLIKRKQSQKYIGQMLKQKIPQEVINKFLLAWNKVASRKFQLRLDCHDSNTLGNLPEIDEKNMLNTILFDKNTVNNENAQRLIAFTIIASRQYNQICSNLEGLFSNVYPELSSLLFSKFKLNPTCIQDEKLMFSFHTQKLKQIVQNYSFQSVQYGISTSHYSFQKIQRLIVREFVGCRYLQAQKQKYNYIRYIGEQVQFITEFRNRPEQLTLQKLGVKRQVDKYLQKKRKNANQDFALAIKDIQGSLEKIIIFYGGNQFEQVNHKTIENFIVENKIKGINQQLRNQILCIIPLAGLADLYQLIEYNSFEFVEDAIDAGYNQDLTTQEKNIIHKLKTQNNQNLPNLKEIKWALYRFAGQTLRTAYDEKQKLSQHLCQIEQYWPKQMNKKKINEVLRRTFSCFTLSKIGGMLRQIPFRQVKQQKVDKKIQILLPNKSNKAKPLKKDKKNR